MRILIGYDGSACANDALDDLPNAGLPRRATALVLSAADVFLPAGRDTGLPRSIRDPIRRARRAAKEQVELAASEAKRGRDRVKKLFPEWRVRAVGRAGSPAWELVARGRKWKADLVVVGAHGHSRFGRFLGSVSQAALTEADRSLRVGRRTERPPTDAPRVLIGIDGSPDAGAAVDAAIRRRWAKGTEFLLVAVIDARKATLTERLTPGSVLTMFDRFDGTRAAADRMLETFAKRFRDRGLSAICVVRRGDPRRVLVDEAVAWRADSILVGARGLGLLKRWMTGGVSAAIAARAPCSVEVVRDPSVPLGRDYEGPHIAARSGLPR